MKTLLAVYGSLKEGFQNHEFLANSDHIANMKLQGGYTMVDLGPFPGIVLKGNTSIYVELYQLNDELTLERIDRLEGYPYFYQKTVVTTPYGEAIMYYLPDTYLKYPVVCNGFWEKK